MDENITDIYELCNATNLTLVAVGSICTKMMSSLASILGATLIITSFILWPDIRTTARAILVFLAIADLISAVGYTFAAILFLTNNDDNNISPSLCTLQSFMTTAFPISSFLWTTSLAVYLFVSITLRRARTAKKLMPLFHVVAWGIPLLLCIPGSATMVLGTQTKVTASTQGTVDWCWVSFNNSFGTDSTIKDATQRLVMLHWLELIFGKFWEIMACTIALILCIIVKILLRKKKKQIKVTTGDAVFGTLNKREAQAALDQLDQKLIWIPIVLVLFRAWSTLRWLIASTYPECSNIDHKCSLIFGQVWFTKECLQVIYHPFLVYMQSIGDTGQGWGNALLYVIFNATIFKRLCPCLYCCWIRVKNCCPSRRRRSEYSPIEYDQDKRQVQLSDSASYVGKLTNTKT